jgi:hypothetical protein
MNACSGVIDREDVLAAEGEFCGVKTVTIRSWAGF